MSVPPRALTLSLPPRARDHVGPARALDLVPLRVPLMSGSVLHAFLASDLPIAHALLRLCCLALAALDQHVMGESTLPAGNSQVRRQVSVWAGWNGSGPAKLIVPS